MYGKIFSSAFTGSMYGLGSDVFAVWSYIIANARDSRIELNPNLLAGIIGTDVSKIEKAIEILCQPDPSSRNSENEGRRLVREGQFQYLVTTHHIYRNMRNDDERREYNRIKQQEYRRSKSIKSVKSDVNDNVLPCTTVYHSVPNQKQKQKQTQKQEKKPPSGVKKRSRVSRDFAPTTEMKAWALELGVELREIRSETDQFLDYHEAQGSLFLDWNAAWRTWMRNVVKWRKPKQEAGDLEIKIPQNMTFGDKNK